MANPFNAVPLNLAGLMDPIVAAATRKAKTQEELQKEERDAALWGAYAANALGAEPSRAQQLMSLNPAAPKLPAMAGGGGRMTMPADPALAPAIAKYASAAGLDPVDVATAMSYETAGTFDPWKAGPTTKWGQHRGLIQWGQPQAKQYGVSQEMPVDQQVAAAIKYLQDRGVRPGAGLMDIYSAINAGSVGREGASDAAAGGAPGTVADKVNNQMAGHRQKAIALLKSAGVQVADADVPAAGAQPVQQGFQVPGSPEGTTGRVPQAVPGAPVPGPSALAITPERRALLGKMLANPSTRAAALAEIQKLQEAQTKQPTYGYQIAPDGTILRTDPTGRTPPTPVYQAGVKPPEPTPLQKDYEVARSQGYTGSLMDFDMARRKAGATSVSTVLPKAEGAYDVEVSKSYAKDFIDIREGEQSAVKTKNALRLMDTLSRDPNFYSGFGGNVAKRTNQALIAMGVKDPNAASPVEVFSGLANEVVMGKLGGKLGAGVSNTDVSFIQQMGPQLAHTPAGNRLLIQFTDRMMDRQMEIAKLARDYARKNGGRLDMGFDEVLTAFAESKPLFSKEDVAAAEQAAKTAEPAPTLMQSIFGGGPKQVETPKGTVTITPLGK